MIWDEEIIYVEDYIQEVKRMLGGNLELNKQQIIAKANFGDFKNDSWKLESIAILSDILENEDELLESILDKLTNDIGAYLSDTYIIDISIYKLFCKYGNELLWLSDPMREPRPKYTTKLTDIQFLTIETIDANFEIIRTGKYSQQLIREMKSEIDGLRHLVTDEVYNLLEKGEKI